MNDDHKAGVGIAGLDQNLRLEVVRGMMDTASFGIAGLNCRSVEQPIDDLLALGDKARCGIAGEIPTQLRQGALTACPRTAHTRSYTRTRDDPRACAPAVVPTAPRGHDPDGSPLKVRCRPC